VRRICSTSARERFIAVAVPEAEAATKNPAAGRQRDFTELFIENQPLLLSG
jgi:hypothetical protein